MKWAKWMTGLLLVGWVWTSNAEIVIESFSNNGTITFTEVTNAGWYRVEWASAPDGPWSGSWSTLDAIPAVGNGAVTAAVPMLYRVVAYDPPPEGMVLIPGGSFVMGNATNAFADDGGGDELPQHTVYVSGFYMDRHEVTKSLWDEVREWALTNGYTFSFAGEGKGPNHPVHTVTWHDAVKWCNARSEREGLPPVYYTNAAHDTVYRTGEIDLFINWVDWSADGYRLPTEAEWEKAARGGVADTRFPWTDFTNNISHAKANYQGYGATFSYDLSDGTHPNYTDDTPPYTAPVGEFTPNGYGLFDMAGNVAEWCWDRYSPSYYETSPSDDPRGPADDDNRVYRGGGWVSSAWESRCSARLSSNPAAPNYWIGFRTVRRQ